MKSDSPQKHQWDYVLECCTSCGATAEALANGDRETECNDGVVGISHIIFMRRAASFFALASRIMDERG